MGDLNLSQLLIQLIQIFLPFFYEKGEEVTYNFLAMDY